MMKCKEASTIVATSDPPEQWHRRLALRLHLTICPECRAFERQLHALADLARESCAVFEREPAADFETNLVRQLASGHKPI